MLTTEQLDAARKMVTVVKTGAEDEAAEALAEDDDYREERQANAREALEDAAVLGHALAALEAYRRVVAQLETWEHIAGMLRDASLCTRWIPAEVCARLRAALEGTP